MIDFVVLSKLKLQITDYYDIINLIQKKNKKYF